MPRPDWYFYFLFYLLRIFKWPDSVFLGTVGIPNILLVLLLALPFIDTADGAADHAASGRHGRGHPDRRLDGRPDVEGRDRQGGARVRGDLSTCRTGSRPEPAAGGDPGAKLFAVSGCTACHTYAGSGSSNLGAPDLTAIGSRNLGIQFQIDHLKCPSCVNPGSPMPKFASLGEKRLRQLAIFLEASKGPQ